MKQKAPPPQKPPRIVEDADDDEDATSVDIEAVTRALGLSFLGGAAESSSSSSESDSSDESDDDTAHDGNDTDEAAKARAAAAKAHRRDERAKQREREKQKRKFARKLKSRGDLDSVAEGNGTGAASSRGGSSSFGFPSLASTAILKFKKLPGASATASNASAASAVRALRSLHKRSDPCLMGESQSLSSEEEEDEKPNYGSMGNTALTAAGGAGAAGGAASPELAVPTAADAIDDCGTPIDLFDPELELSSPAVLRLRTQSSIESTGLDRLTDVDKEILATMRPSHVQRVRSTSDAGSVQHPQTHTVTADKATPAVGARGHGLRRSLLRVWGKINNSYFAYWLVVCSIVVIALDVLAVIFVKATFNANHDAYGKRIAHRALQLQDAGSALQTPLPLPDRDDACDWRLQLLRGMHYVGIPNVLLVVPVLFSSEYVALYKSKDNRIVRCAYLQVCELIITAQMAFMLYFAVDQVLNLPETVRCHETYTASEIAMLYSSLVMWCVLMRQIVLFCRFITHQKLQADGANDANHTSAMNSWLKRCVILSCDGWAVVVC